MEFCGWHAILENEFIYSAAEYIRIVQLGRFSAISSALPRALGPIHFPVAPGRLGFNVDKRNAVHKEQDIGADVILWSFNPEVSSAPAATRETELNAATKIRLDRILIIYQI